MGHIRAKWNGLVLLINIVVALATKHIIVTISLHMVRLSCMAKLIIYMLKYSLNWANLAQAKDLIYVSDPALITRLKLSDIDSYVAKSVWQENSSYKSLTTH